MDNRELIQEIREGVNTLPERWRSDDAIIRKANLGLSHLATILSKNYEEPLVKRGFIDIVGGKRFYDLPSDCINERVRKVSIYYSGAYYPLDYEDLNTLKDIEAANSSYGFPTLVGLLDSNIYTIQGKQIIFERAPSNSVTDGIEIWYVARPLRLGKIIGEVSAIFDKAPITATYSSPNLTMTFSDRDGLDDLVAGYEMDLSGFPTSGNNVRGTITSITPSTKTLVVNVGLSGGTETVLTDAKVTSVRISLDSIDSTLVGNEYLTVSSRTTGEAISHFQVASVPSTTDITIRATPYASTKKGYTISGNFQGVMQGDLICSLGETGTFPIDDSYYNYVVAYAIVQLTLEAKEPITELLQTLKDLEKEVRSSYSNRAQKIRIRDESTSFRRGY